MTLPKKVASWRYADCDIPQQILLKSQCFVFFFFYSVNRGKFYPKNSDHIWLLWYLSKHELRHTRIMLNQLAHLHSLFFFTARLCVRGCAVAQSVECATPGEVPGSIPPVAAHSLLVGSVSVYMCNVTGWDKTRGLPAVSCVAARKIVRRSVLGPVRDIALLLRRTLRNQTNKQTKSLCPCVSCLNNFYKIYREVEKMHNYLSQRTCAEKFMGEGYAQLGFFTAETDTTIRNRDRFCMGEIHKLNLCMCTGTAKRGSVVSCTKQLGTVRIPQSISSQMDASI